MAALAALYVAGDHWERPCRTYHYAPGSPQARAEEIYRQQRANEPFVGGSEEWYRESLTYPIKVVLMNDGWHVYDDASRCNIFGQFKTGMFGGGSLILDRESLKVVKVVRGQ